MPVVGVLTDYFVTTLEQARAVAVWATGEEWWGAADVDLLAEFVDELRGMARRALADGPDAYCWIWAGCGWNTTGGTWGDRRPWCSTIGADLGQPNAPSRMSRPRANSSSEMTSGGRNRSTLPYVPQVRVSRPAA